VLADVSSGGQERARIARPQGLVLDGHEDGGTMAANEARGEGPMRDIDLFQLALGLVPPWMVVDAKFDADQKRLDIEIDFKTGGRFACPKCGKADCPVHDTVKKTWRHLNFFQHEAFLHARVARIDCPDCGVRLINVPWARPGSGFTLLFEALVMALVKDMPVAAAAVACVAGLQVRRCGIAFVANLTSCPSNSAINCCQKCAAPGLLIILDPWASSVFEDMVGGRFSEGRAAVRLGGLYGFVDEDGREIVEPKYRIVDDYSSGFAQVDVDGKSGLIDRVGRMAIEPKYGSITAISRSLWCVGRSAAGRKQGLRGFFRRALGLRWGQFQSFNSVPFGSALPSHSCRGCCAAVEGESVPGSEVAFPRISPANCTES
jgi:hypothetical protein